MANCFSSDAQGRYVQRFVANLSPRGVDHLDHGAGLFFAHASRHQLFYRFVSVDQLPSSAFSACALRHHD